MITLRQLREKINFKAYRDERHELSPVHYNHEKGLTNDEAGATGHYAGKAFQDVNSHLFRKAAGQKRDPEKDRYVAHGDEKDVEDSVKHLKSAIKKRTNKLDHYVYRGVHNSHLPSDWHDNDKAEIHHHGFLSTSTKPKVADGFARYKSNDHKEDDYSDKHVLKIRVKAGTPSHYRTGYPYSDGEKEHLLLPGKLTKRKPSTRVNGYQYATIYHHVDYTPNKD